MDLDIFGPYYKVRSSLPSAYGSGSFPRSNDFSRFDDASYFRQLVALDDTFSKATAPPRRPEQHWEQRVPSSEPFPSDERPPGDEHPASNGKHSFPSKSEPAESSPTFTQHGLSAARSEFGTTTSKTIRGSSASNTFGKSESPFIRFDLGSGSPYFGHGEPNRSVNEPHDRAAKSTFPSDAPSPTPANPAEEIHFERRHFSKSPRINRQSGRTGTTPFTSPASKVLHMTPSPKPPLKFVDGNLTPPPYPSPSHAQATMEKPFHAKNFPCGGDNPLRTFCLDIDSTMGRISVLLNELQERDQLVTTDETLKVCEQTIALMTANQTAEPDRAIEDDDDVSISDLSETTDEGDIEPPLLETETELFTPGKHNVHLGGSWWELLQPVSRELSRFVLLHSAAATSPLPSLSPVPLHRLHTVTQDDELNHISNNFDTITQELSELASQSQMSQIGKALNEVLSLLNTGIERDWTVSDDDLAPKKADLQSATSELASYHEERKRQSESKSSLSGGHDEKVSASSRKAQLQSLLRENYEAISQAERVLQNTTRQLAVLLERRKTLANDFVANEIKHESSNRSDLNPRNQIAKEERDINLLTRGVRRAQQQVDAAEKDKTIATMLLTNVYKPLTQALHPQTHVPSRHGRWEGTDPTKSLNFDI